MNARAELNFMWINYWWLKEMKKQNDFHERILRFSRSKDAGKASEKQERKMQETEEKTSDEEKQNIKADEERTSSWVVPIKTSLPLDSFTRVNSKLKAILSNRHSRRGSYFSPLSRFSFYPSPFTCFSFFLSLSHTSTNVTWWWQEYINTDITEKKDGDGEGSQEQGMKSVREEKKKEK